MSVNNCIQEVIVWNRVIFFSQPQSKQIKHRTGAVEKKHYAMQ